MSDFLRLHALQPPSLLCPWNSPGKNAGVGCHSLLQGIFLTLGSNPSLLHCRHILYCPSHQSIAIARYNLYFRKTLATVLSKATAEKPTRRPLKKKRWEMLVACTSMVIVWVVSSDSILNVFWRERFWNLFTGWLELMREKSLGH